MNPQNIMPLMANTLEIYTTLFKPLCKEYELPQTALDILMFLANNPQRDTAKDITKYRGIPANLVSKYVEILVEKELLARSPIPGNRRSIRLTCTAQADTIIEKGRETQKQFFSLLYQNIRPDELEIFLDITKRLADNILSAKETLRKEDQK